MWECHGERRKNRLSNGIFNAMSMVHGTYTHYALTNKRTFRNAFDCERYGLAPFAMHIHTKCIHRRCICNKIELIQTSFASECELPSADSVEFKLEWHEERRFALSTFWIDNFLFILSPFDNIIHIRCDWRTCVWQRQCDGQSQHAPYNWMEAYKSNDIFVFCHLNYAIWLAWLSHYKHEC